jgi:hypothetical protein
MRGSGCACAASCARCTNGAAGRGEAPRRQRLSQMRVGEASATSVARGRRRFRSGMVGEIFGYQIGRRCNDRPAHPPRLKSAPSGRFLPAQRTRRRRTTTWPRPPSPVTRHPKARSEHRGYGSRPRRSAPRRRSLPGPDQEKRGRRWGEGWPPPPAGPTQLQGFKFSTALTHPPHRSRTSRSRVARSERCDEGWETHVHDAPSGHSLHIHRPWPRRASDQSRECPDGAHLDTGEFVRRGTGRMFVGCSASMRTLVRLRARA